MMKRSILILGLVSSAAGCAYQPQPLTAVRPPAASEVRAPRGEVDLRLQTKSFIAPIDDGRALNQRLGFDSDPRVQDRARPLMSLTDAMFSEDPQAPHRADGDFRLHSDKQLQVACEGDRVSWFGEQPLTIDVGYDAGMKGSGRVVHDYVRLEDGVLRFVLEMRGAPPIAIEHAFDAVADRSCRSIWHRLEGEVRCRAGTPIVSTQLDGSQFPSHRAWLGETSLAALEQGPFENLWRCHEGDATRIA